MRRLCAVLLVMLGLPLVADAQENPTIELLEAPPIRRYIRILLVPDKHGGDTYVLRYGVDTFSDTDVLTDGVVFRADSGADIYIGDFNPLQQSFKVEDKETPDVSFASLKAFFDDLQKLQANLPGAPATPGGAIAAAPPTETDCQRLKRLMENVHRALERDELTPQTLKTIVDGAVGFAGVRRAASDLEQKKIEIDGNIRGAKDALEMIRAEYGSEFGTAPARHCDDLTPLRETVTQFTIVRANATKILDAKQKLSDSIQKVIDELAPYRIEANWRGPESRSGEANSLRDWDLRKITPDFVNQRTVTVVAKARDVVFDDTGVLVTKDYDASARTNTFRIRQDSLLVPERAAAVVYNRLKYPKYTPKTNPDGTIVVQRTEEQDPWNGAVLLNLVARLGSRKSVVYPMFQLGLSTAKDFPGALIGVGARFTRPVAFGLSVGGIITRYKDLDDTLQEGSTVTGQGDIDKHLEFRTSPTVLYGAVQVKF